MKVGIKVCRKLPYEELQIKFETSNNEIKTQLMDGAILAFLECTKIMVADFNLFGSVGDLYCFSNTLSMLVANMVLPKLLFACT